MAEDNDLKKVSLELKASDFLTVFFDSFFAKLQKLLDEDPRGFRYVAAGALVGGGVAVATGGASLGVAAVGAAVGSLVGFVTVGFARAVKPVDRKRIVSGVDDLLHQLKRLSNFAPIFHEAQMNTFKKIKEDSQKLIDDQLGEVYAEKILRRLIAFQDRVNERVNLIDNAYEIKRYSEKLDLIGRRKKFARERRLEMKKFILLKDRLEKQELLSGEASKFSRDLIVWMRKIDKHVGSAE